MTRTEGVFEVRVQTDELEPEIRNRQVRLKRELQKWRVTPDISEAIATGEISSAKSFCRRCNRTD